MYSRVPIPASTVMLCTHTQTKALETYKKKSCSILVYVNSSNTYTQANVGEAARSFAACPSTHFPCVLNCCYTSTCIENNYFGNIRKLIRISILVKQLTFSFRSQWNSSGRAKFICMQINSKILLYIYKKWYYLFSMLNTFRCLVCTMLFTNIVIIFKLPILLYNAMYKSIYKFSIRER